MDFLKILIFALLVTPLQTVYADFNFASPGPLSKDHAPFESRNQCTLCHEQGQQVVSTKCLECHQELHSRINANRGFHGKMGNEITKCGLCHPEHAGRDLKLIKWETTQEEFDHNQTGFELKGKHSGTTCAKCHDPKFVKEADILSLLRKLPKTKTFLGLSTQCNNCHFDEHRGQVGLKCESCHDEVEFKKAPLFSHSRADFPLIGKHRTVACSKCHVEQKEGKATFMKLTGIPHETCENCHKDIHEGKFGKNCEGCHSPEDWKKLHGKMPADRAFHEKTTFPLRGAHIAVACASCHAGANPKYKGLKHEKCTNCHIDAHLGQLPKDCEKCHTVEKFKPSTFKFRDHANTRYPLEGAHQSVDCDKCHRPSDSITKRISPQIRARLKSLGRKDKFNTAIFKFSDPLDRCDTCHADPHQGQFIHNGAPKACASCHQVSGFKNLLFDHNRDCKYPLSGRHARVQCEGCHPKQTFSKGKVVRYMGVPLECEGCHEDVHVGQFTKKPNSKAECKRCHTTLDFQKKILFDHNDIKFTNYALQGRHASVDCDKCHQKVEVAPNVRVTKYIGLPRACDGCHIDEHKGLFHKYEP